MHEGTTLKISTCGADACIDFRFVRSGRSSLAMSGALILTECRHYFARKQINALIRIHVAENDCEELYPFAHALA